MPWLEIGGLEIYKTELIALAKLSPIEQVAYLRKILKRVPVWAWGIVTATVLSKIYLKQKWKYWERQGIKGPTPTIGKFGNGTDIMMVSTGEMSPFEWVEKYGKLSGGYFGTAPFLMVSDVELVKEITIKQFSKFHRREANSTMRGVIGKLSKDWMSLVEGDKWKRIRHTTSPMMSQSKLEQVLPLVQNAAKVLVNDYILPDKEYDTKDLSSAYTIKAIMSSGFSIDPADKGSIDTAERHALQIIPGNASMMKFVLMSLIPECIRYYFNVTVYPTETDDYFRNLFAHLQQEFKRREQAGQKQNFDFSSLMMANEITEESAKTAKKGFTEKEMLANSILFIAAGHETTASTLQFFWYLICMNPQIQEKIYETIKNTGDFNYEEIRDFKYLDACIKETMRMYPPTPQLARYCSESTIIGENVQVEKGTTVLWMNTYFHMQPDYYHNPKVFDPTRWEGNESNTLQDDHWFGFGHGPRACPGTRWAHLTIKMIVIETIKKYEIIPTANTPTEVRAVLKNLKVASDKPMMLKFRKR